MTKKFVDCFMLMGTALSLRSGHKLPEMGRPLLQDLTVTKINISLSLLDLKIVSHQNLEVEMTTLLNQKWVDPRLGANLKTRKMAVAGQIWKPKIVNVNGDNTIKNNEDTVFWRGYGDEGYIVLSEKFTIKTRCTNNYRRFPFDVQMCQFKFGTYRFPQEEVLLIWDPTPIEITTNIIFNEFKLIDTEAYVMTDIRSSGNFSTAVVQLAFKRNFQFYIHWIMFPSALLSLLNYIPFWFSLNQRSSRLYINLGIFVFLINFIFISVNCITVTPYLTALDIFVLGCALFSFGTLAETIFVNLVCGVEESNFHLRKVASSKEYPRIVLGLEVLMKLAYFVLYIFFLIVYCCMYF